MIPKLEPLVRSAPAKCADTQSCIRLGMEIMALLRQYAEDNPEPDSGQNKSGGEEDSPRLGNSRKKTGEENNAGQDAAQSPQPKPDSGADSEANAAEQADNALAYSDKSPENQDKPDNPQTGVGESTKTEAQTCPQTLQQLLDDPGLTHLKKVLTLGDER